MMVHGPGHFDRPFLQLLECPRQRRATASLASRIPPLHFEATNGHAFDALFAPFFAGLPIIENNIQRRRNSGRGTLPRQCPVLVREFASQPNTAETAS